MKKIILFFIVFIYFTINLNAFDIKNLGTIDSYVIDKVGVLNNEEKNEIEQKIIELKTKYTTEILTIIIDSTDGEDISSIGTQIGQDLGVGKSDKDNGVVILIAIDDRSWNISTGYGVEGVLPDILTNRIGENNFVLFRDEKYKDGIMGALNDFDKVFSGDTSIISNQKNVDETTGSISIIQFILALLLSSFIFKPMMVDYKYKKVFLYLLIAYIITLPLAYLAVQNIFFFLQNAFIWLMGFIFGVFGKAANIGSSKGGRNNSGKGGSSRGGGFGGFGGGSFGGGGSSGKW